MKSEINLWAISQDIRYIIDISVEIFSFMIIAATPSGKP